MKNKISNDELNEAFLRLEKLQSEERRILENQIRSTHEKDKPINIVGWVTNETPPSPDSKAGMLSTTAGLAAGYFAKALIVRGSRNPVKRILGTVIMFGITNYIAKHPDAVRSFIRKVRSIIGHRSKKNDRIQADEEMK